MNKILSDQQLRGLLSGTGITFPIRHSASVTAKALIGLYIIIAFFCAGFFCAYINHLFMKNYLIILTVAALLSACNNSSSDKKEEQANHGGHAHEQAGHSDHNDPRTKELMAIHDSIMPKMGTVMDLKQQLKHQVKTLDSLALIKSDPALKSQKARALALVDQLESADQSMMGWMHQYKADTLKQLQTKQAEDYIAAQKEKIVSVRDQTLAGIADAKEFLRKNKKP